MASIIPSDLIAPFLLTAQRGPMGAEAIDWTWKETSKSHIFIFDLPGYSKSDINIDIHTDTRVLHITTKTEKKEESEKDVTWHCRERSGGKKISKQFRLPKDARFDNGISASMRDGVLVVTVEKEKSCDENEKLEEVVKKRSRSIEIQGKDDQRGGKGGVLGKCFVCFKS